MRMENYFRSYNFKMLCETCETNLLEINYQLNIEHAFPKMQQKRTTHLYPNHRYPHHSIFIDKIATAYSLEYFNKM